MGLSCCAVLVNYRGAAEIAAAVESVLADAPGIEVRVVDNSDDGHEWALLQSLLPKSVHCHRADGNIGFGRGCNLAVHASSADCFFLVNPDVRLVRGCTRALMDALADDATLGAIAPRQFLDPALQWHLPPSWLPTAVRAWATERARREPTIRGRVRHATGAEALRHWQAHHAPLRQRALSGGALMVHRRALDVGGDLFDPQFFMYFEDSDLCMRLRHQGWGMAMVPQAHAVHAWRNAPHKQGLMEAGAAVYFAKHYADDRWLHKTQGLQNPHPGAMEEPSQPGTRAIEGIELAVPESLQAGWVLELSPDPLRQICIGHLGTGERARASYRTLEHFGAGPVFARLRSSRQEQTGVQVMATFEPPHNRPQEAGAGSTT
ncbi:MAG: glycosyltransferase family 2 protein [Pseudomonadota bacterium]